MARLRSLTDLIADVRQRTDMVDSEFVTDEEITEYLNQELAELDVRLALNEGQPHVRASQSISVVAGTSLYALPASFWQVQEVTASLDGHEVTLQPFMPTERSLLGTSMVMAPYVAPMYRIQAGNIEFLPDNRTYTATLYYRRASPRLVDPGDEVDGYNGYEVAAIYGACATVQRKEDNDPSFYMGLKDRIYRLIDAAAAKRDASNPERVQDVVGWDPFGWGY